MYYSTKLPNLVSRQFDDEVILANFKTGLYYSLVGVAADIWLGLDAGRSRDDIAAVIAQAEGPDAVQEIQAFVDRLATEAVIAPREDHPEARPWSPQFSNPYAPPTLDFFDDLRDLLFLDPVHDVSEAGWPVRSTDDV